MTAPLPCHGRAALYDAVLWPDAGTPDPAARTEAARLCATCPAPCEQRIAEDTGPRPVMLLDEDWLPPAREGRPDPRPASAAGGRRRTRAQPPPAGRDFVRPARRPAAWARMAAADAAAGHALPEIAARLCVTEDTVRALLAAESGRAA